MFEQPDVFRLVQILRDIDRRSQHDLRRVAAFQLAGAERIRNPIAAGTVLLEVRPNRDAMATRVVKGSVVKNAAAAVRKGGSAIYAEF